MDKQEFEKVFAAAAEKSGIAELARKNQFAENLEAMMFELRDKLNSLHTEEELNKEIDRFLADNVGKINNVGQIARHFAQWQKEQMMKSAIEVKINRDTLYNLKPIIHEKYQDLKIGNKILIIKEDKQ